jgi:hypothetical protein
LGYECPFGAKCQARPVKVTDPERSEWSKVMIQKVIDQFRQKKLRRCRYMLLSSKKMDKRL